jgi:hypothetical protein
MSSSKQAYVDLSTLPAFSYYKDLDSLIFGALKRLLGNHCSLSHHCIKENNLIYGSYDGNKSCELATRRSMLFMSMWPPTGILFIPQMARVWTATVEWHEQGKIKEVGDKPVLCHYAHHKSHMNCPGSEPGPPL